MIKNGCKKGQRLVKKRLWLTRTSYFFYMFAGIKRDDFHFNYTKADAKQASFLAKEILTARYRIHNATKS